MFFGILLTGSIYAIEISVSPDGAVKNLLEARDAVRSARTSNPNESATIIVATEPQVTYIDLRHSSPNWNIIDENIAWNVSGSIRTKYRLINNDEWATWLALGWDQRSIVADPLFENFQNRNFKLETESPAFKLGFCETPHRKIGIQAQ